MANSRNSSRSRGKSSSKKRKNSGGAYVYILYSVCMIAGLILGGILYRHITKNDGFTIIGDQTVTLTLGFDSGYTDPGASVIWFGKDYSDRISVETNLTKKGDGYTFDSSMPGSYYISYTTDMLGYEGVKLIRTIRVVEDEATGGS